MKKVRFESPVKLGMDLMQEYECHSPRPFLERQIVRVDGYANRGVPVVFTNDPLHRFENDNSVPYPNVNKTCLDVVQEVETKKVPSSDLDLSMLDWSNSGTRIPSQKINTTFGKQPRRIVPVNSLKSASQTSHSVLTSIENTTYGIQPNGRENEFFLKRDNFGKISLDSMCSKLDQFYIHNENNPHRKNSEFVKKVTCTLSGKENHAPTGVEFKTDCSCHHCVKIVTNTPHNMVQNNSRNLECFNRINCNVHDCVPTSINCSCNCNMHVIKPTCNSCNKPQHSPLIPQNAIDKKTWAIEKYEKNCEGASAEVEKSNIMVKEKREPTVSDLFKIIKLQNEQLQLLQEKVDKFILTHNSEIHEKQKLGTQDCASNQLAVQTVNSEQHRMSIGVMTSFEMVRTSTVINKEIVQQCEAQIQCNRSQISIKEVVSKKQVGNLNFLEGISPVCTNLDHSKGGLKLNSNNNDSCYVDNIIEDKTLNELSLYNVQVDNATTPLISPEQSLYLDIRDYSESDSGSDDQSNVGWTYYNKVMTHVNGMLQDSDMPSSASALYRQTKHRCMQIDKSNVSVGKRVTFGDDPLGIHQHQVTTPTDTSLKMNQLAAKYLKYMPPSHPPSPKATDEMSFATRKYMETHKLLQGQKPIQPDIPRFLDITALKQQPKLI